MLVYVKNGYSGAALALGVRVPFNLGGLEAALISKLLELKVQKFRNQIGLEVENSRGGEVKRKFCPALP